MEVDNLSQDELEGDKMLKQNNVEPLLLSSSNKISIPLIAGILLIVSGVIGILFSISLVTIDISTIESTGILAQFQKVDPSITAEQARSWLSICGTIITILAVFPILGGILSLKRKMWGVCLTCGVLGLFTITSPWLLSSILALIGVILLTISKKEFQ